MNSWSLLHDYMNEMKDDAPWIDTKYDGFDEEQIKKVLKAQRQAQKLLDAAHRVADGGVPLGKLIREGHQDPMSARVRYEYAAILRTIIEQCGYTKDELLVVNICDILDIIEVLNNE
jgi:hypothetical protein